LRFIETYTVFAKNSLCKETELYKKTFLSVHYKQPKTLYTKYNSHQFTPTKTFDWYWYNVRPRQYNIPDVAKPKQQKIPTNADNYNSPKYHINMK